MELFEPIWDYARHLDGLEASGLVFGVACVWLLIKQNIWTWPVGIVYVLVSFVVFFQARLYADLALHVVFLVLNVYGWYHWLRGGPRAEDDLPVTTSAPRLLAGLAVLSAFGVALSGVLLSRYTDASLPYWDSATSVLSIAAMWMQAQKKIEHWVVWLVVDVLATGIYVYKAIYFYALLYLFYVGMAVAGLQAWRRDLLDRQEVPAPVPGASA
jgi:nicotinamide mononucleotide transporter